jgi:hypothetical protein
MKKVILKYLTDNITDSELEQLLLWLKKPKNLKEFQTLIKENYNLNIVYDDINEEIALQKVKRDIKNSKKPVRRLSLNLMKYAAAILIFVSAGSFFLTTDNLVDESNPIIINNNIKIGTDKATLTLENGTDIILEKGENYISGNLKSNGEDIIYKSTGKSNPNITYNYLTIPRGGQYHVKLTDETEIWLNSESRLKYPTSFVDGEERIVELVYGEAYFIVSSSTENKGSSFKVKTSIQEIEVLGTQFNVKAYNDEDYIYTTLIEGKVSIDNTSGLEILKPNQQSILNIASKEIQINTIDVSSEIAWVHGDFIFNRKPLKDIMKVLSRWYDVDVKFKDKALEDTKFFGELSKHQNIEDILTLIKSTNTINSFEINKNKILIK